MSGDDHEQFFVAEDGQRLYAIKTGSSNRMEQYNMTIPYDVDTITQGNLTTINENYFKMRKTNKPEDEDKVKLRCAVARATRTTRTTFN